MGAGQRGVLNRKTFSEWEDEFYKGISTNHVKDAVSAWEDAFNEVENFSQADSLFGFTHFDNLQKEVGPKELKDMRERILSLMKEKANCSIHFYRLAEIFEEREKTKEATEEADKE